MTTLTADEAREMLAGMIEKKPDSVPADTHAPFSKAGIWLWTFTVGWSARIDLDDLNTAVRCCEAAGARCCLAVGKEGCGSAAVGDMADKGEYLDWLDGRHALHLMEALLSAVTGEDTRINMEGG